jgi:hypothetical protein
MAGGRGTGEVLVYYLLTDWIDWMVRTEYAGCGGGGEKYEDEDWIELAFSGS